MNERRQHGAEDDQATISYAMELDALADGWTGRIGTHAVQRIRHLADGYPLYVPGSGFGGASVLCRAPAAGRSPQPSPQP